MTRKKKEARKAMGEMTRELAALPHMSVAELAERYEAVYREPSRSRNKDWLRKKVAWRIQELAEGGLSPRAKARIDELNDETELEWPRPRKRMNTEAVDAGRDPRLPPTGTVLVRPYKGVEYQVTVLQSGFQYAGQHYASLSKIAQEITGTHWNGFLFFKLQSRAAKTKGGAA